MRQAPHVNQLITNRLNFVNASTCIGITSQKLRDKAVSLRIISEGSFADLQQKRSHYRDQQDFQGGNSQSSLRSDDEKFDSRKLISWISYWCYLDHTVLLSVSLRLPTEQRICVACNSWASLPIHSWPNFSKSIYGNNITPLCPACNQILLKLNFSAGGVKECTTAAVTKFPLLKQDINPRQDLWILVSSFSKKRMHYLFAWALTVYGLDAVRQYTCHALIYLKPYLPYRKGLPKSLIMEHHEGMLCSLTEEGSLGNLHPH